DGAGVQTQLPQALFAKVLASMKAAPAAPGDLAVGMMFLSQDAAKAARAARIAEEVVRRRGIALIGWRDVPIDPSVLGEKARQALPFIRQLLMRRPAAIAPEQFERTLFLARRQMEQRFEREDLRDCYIPSCSSRTIVYKGLLVAPQLESFYLDLRDPEFASAIAVFHQRYSTNTFPTWPLAQPFRFLSHNGEINTLQGNRNWMAAREPALSSAVWGGDLKELWPIIQPGGSDSMSLDNALELLVMSGRDILQAMMMLVPDAWQNMPEMDPAVRAFYQYHALLTTRSSPSRGTGRRRWRSPTAPSWGRVSTATACAPRATGALTTGSSSWAPRSGSWSCPPRRSPRRGAWAPGRCSPSTPSAGSS
ncbi:MAG: glutamate synthase subunit alpha, partial [Candidatus Omnitrophica bacterium]|nr:glutamate synthase subunit alpha [Candidatus Omnitrophota bacterium]